MKATLGPFALCTVGEILIRTIPKWWYMPPIRFRKQAETLSVLYTPPLHMHSAVAGRRNLPSPHYAVA